MQPREGDSPLCQLSKSLFGNDMVSEKCTTQKNGIFLECNCVRSGPEFPREVADGNCGGPPPSVMLPAFPLEENFQNVIQRKLQEFHDHVANFVTEIHTEITSQVVNIEQEKNLEFNAPTCKKFQNLAGPGGKQNLASPGKISGCEILLEGVGDETGG